METMTLKEVEMDKANIELVPRWIWKQVEIPASGEAFIDPSDFANTSAYPMRLHWVSVCGKVATGDAPYNVVDGGPLRRMDVELGVTGYSDVNLVPSVGLSLFCSGHYTQKYARLAQYDHGVNLELPRPIRIPKDGGLVVEVQNTYNDVLTYGQFTVNPIMRRPTLVGLGYYEESRIPGILAGSLKEDLPRYAKTLINSSDLLNRGREAFILTNLSVDSGSAVYLDFVFEEQSFIIAGLTVNHMTNIAWRVNPVSGVEWMPQNDPIPVGCLAPNTRVRDTDDEGPKCYNFSRNVVLMPRQRFGLKMTDVSGVAQTVNVCLHGELEVR